MSKRRHGDHGSSVKAAASARPHDAEVAAVDRGNLLHSQPLGGRDDRGVDGSEREVAIARGELGDAQPVSSDNGLDAERTRGEVAEEAHFRPADRGARPSGAATHTSTGWSQGRQRARGGSVKLFW